MSERETSFDPGDPFDAMAESFRHQTIDMVLKVMGHELGKAKILECFVAGVLTGLVGITFLSVERSGREEVMKFIEDYLQQVRLRVEDTIDEVVK